MDDRSPNHDNERSLLKRIAMQPFLSFLLLLAAPVLAQQEVDTLIVGGHVFQTESGKFVPNTGIAIKDSRSQRLLRTWISFQRPTHFIILFVFLGVALPLLVGT